MGKKNQSTSHLSKVLLALHISLSCNHAVLFSCLLFTPRTPEGIYVWGTVKRNVTVLVTYSWCTRKGSVAGSRLCFIVPAHHCATVLRWWLWPGSAVQLHAAMCQGPECLCIRNPCCVSFHQTAKALTASSFLILDPFCLRGEWSLISALECLMTYWKWSHVFHS